MFDENRVTPSMRISGISQLLEQLGVSHVLVAASPFGEAVWEGHYVLRPSKRQTPYEIWQAFCKKFKLREVTSLHDLRDLYAPFLYEFATRDHSVEVRTSCNPLEPQTSDRSALGSVMLRVREHANPDIHAFQTLRSELMRISTVPRVQRRSTKIEMLERESATRRMQEADRAREISFQAFQAKRGSTLHDFSDLGK